ncbi:putative nima interactive protein [Golovinomyces cichoracearum]|uniref:Putative nima interactive protein n=1 Tax=Golovinomyces cichoracearum TaxID=62708 RepID=A0A420J6R8_9PEZI|nr:putative nima interactive protein [Golovinomyces cichoracearum]
MDHENLETASQYLNNQLLSRGLLRHKEVIDFTCQKCQDDNPARIMKVVSDLILHRDRDFDQRENMSETIRILRTDTARQSVELEKFKEGKRNISRKLAAAESEKKILEDKLKMSEAKERTQKVEIEKMKCTVAQVRAACAFDSRKREKVIEGLKKTISEIGRVRGGKKSGAREIVIVGGTGEGQENVPMMSVKTEAYNLRYETNDFLTELAQNLSEENEKLSRVLRRALDTLITFSGWNPSQENKRQKFETGPENLVSEMEAVIEHVKTILTNPNFVSLEELEMREEEIIRLRQGWEHMENRWKDAVCMIDSWRKRMMYGGETVNFEELRMGLQLSPHISTEGDHQNNEQSFIQEESINIDASTNLTDTIDLPKAKSSQPELDENKIGSGFSFAEESSLLIEYPNKDEETTDLRVNRPEQPEVANDTVSMPYGRALLLSDLNDRSTIPYSPEHASPKKEKKGFSPIIEENTLDLLELEMSTSRVGTQSISLEQNHVRIPGVVDKEHDGTNFEHSRTPNFNIKVKSERLSISPSSISTPKSSNLTPQRRQKLSSSPQKLNSYFDSQISNKFSKLKNSCTKISQRNSRLKRSPEHHFSHLRQVAPLETPLTMANIAAKLAVSERDVDTSRVRAKLQAARSGKAVSQVADKNRSSHLGVEKSKLEPKSDVTPAKLISSIEKGQHFFGNDEAQKKKISGSRDNTPSKEANIYVTTTQQQQNRKRKAKEASCREIGKNRRRRNTLISWEPEKIIQGTEPEVQ